MPFRIADDVYYVGTRSLSSFLLTTSQGHILMNTGVADGVPLLTASIQQLGFSVTDIKILLVSHAHYDHVGGFAEMKRLTGAQVVALGDDAVSLERGQEVWTGGEDWPPVRVDRILQDGDVVSIGGVRLTARLTPGHTKGATTWVTELRFEGQSYPAVFVGGAGPNDGVPLVSNTVYSQVASDYAHTFRVLKELRPEFFFQPHPQGFGMEQKARRLLAGERPNPFIDRKGYAASVQRSETTYLEQLSKEQSSASPRDR
jgi:metallo-beta-lactamase class B